MPGNAPPVLVHERNNQDKRASSYHQAPQDYDSIFHRQTSTSYQEAKISSREFARMAEATCIVHILLARRKARANEVGTVWFGEFVVSEGRLLSLAQGGRAKAQPVLFAACQIVVGFVVDPLSQIKPWPINS